MSARASGPQWVSALDDLLKRCWALERLAPGRDPEKTRTLPNPRLYGLVGSLDRQFMKYSCWSHQGDGYRVDPPGGDTPEEFVIVAPAVPPETEKAALNAVLDWLKPAPYYPPFTNPQEQQELKALRRRLARAAQDRLDALEDRQPPAGGPVVPPEWEGDDWEALDPKVRQLLLHMLGREEANLQGLCLAVWGKDCADVSESARETATSKANNFLRKRESSRQLRKVRGENWLRWE
jgi:hypothetical protein